jgi:hypothetical protein
MEALSFTREPARAHSIPFCPRSGRSLHTRVMSSECVSPTKQRGVRELVGQPFGWCSILCSARVGKRQISTGEDRIAIERFSAGNREIPRDSRDGDQTLLGLANRRFRPLSHLTVRL